MHERVNVHKLDRAGGRFDLILLETQSASGREYQCRANTFPAAEHAVAHRLVQTRRDYICAWKPRRESPFHPRPPGFELGVECVRRCGFRRRGSRVIACDVHTLTPAAAWSVRLRFVTMLIVLAVGELHLRYGDGDSGGETRTVAVGNGQFARQRPRYARSEKRGFQGLQRVTERVIYCGALEATVCHAVVAPRVLADAIVLPLRTVDQRSIGWRVAFIRKQIAGPLPAEYVKRRIAPRRTLVALIAGEKIEKQRRVIEGPLGTGRAVGTAAKDLAEEIFARRSTQKHILFRGVMVAVPGRYRDAFDTKPHR